MFGAVLGRPGGFSLFRGLGGLGLLIALRGSFYGLRGGFLFCWRGRRLLRLGAEPAPVAPTPQEVEEEAAKAALEPTEAQRKAGYCRKRQINIGDPDVTIETAMGAEDNFPYLFFRTRGKLRLRGQVYQFFGHGLIARSAPRYAIKDDGFIIAKIIE